MKKTKLFLEAAIVIAVALALIMPGSAVITNTTTEEITLNMELKKIEEPISIGGPIKVKMQKTPLVLGEGNPSKSSRGTDVRVTSLPEFEGNPALAIDSEGTMLVCYEYEEDIMERNIGMASSNDGGQTWTDQGYWPIEGTVDELVSLDYTGLINDGQRFDGNFLCSDNDYGDAYHIEIPDINGDPADWVVWTTTWNDNGFSDFTSCDITSHDQVIGASTDYFTMSWIGSFEGIAGYPDCYEVPLYQIRVDDSSWIYWFYYNYSANGRMDIDRTAEIIYYAFEWENVDNQDVILLSSELEYVGEVEPAGWGDGMGEGRKYAVEGSANAVNPAIAAEDGYVYLILETDQGGDQDIVCYYSSDSGESYGMSVIADSGSDETNPVVYASGQDAICVFTKDNYLYMAVTHDGGENWEVDVDPINDVAGSAVEQYKCADVFGASVVWTDDRNDDGDVYYDSTNNPPEAPTITGEIDGDAGTAYEYTFTATDPDGDDIAEFLIDWGDETQDALAGPSPAKMSHTYSAGGDFIITARAKDANGLIGPEGSLTVTMPRSRTIDLPILKFLQNYPILFKIVQHLFGL